MAVFFVLFGWFITAMVKGIVLFVKGVVAVLTVIVVLIKNIIGTISDSIKERKLKSKLTI